MVTAAKEGNRSLEKSAAENFYARSSTVSTQPHFFSLHHDDAEESGRCCR
jgi:hypothetical protein